MAVAGDYSKLYFFINITLSNAYVLIEKGYTHLIILGISCFYHDSAAAILKDGKVVAAAQEERFTRVKNDASFPSNSIRFCCEFANIDFEGIDAIAYYEQTSIKRNRQIAFNQSSHTMLGDESKCTSGKELFSHFFSKHSWHIEHIPFLEFPHHMSHAASAFFPGPFQQAAIITIDGVGEWDTLTIGLGQGSKIGIIERMQFPHSIGLLYSSFTDFCGFKVNSGEYKLMGLAPYGKPKYKDLILDHILIRNEGIFPKLNMKFFSFVNSSRMTSDAFSKLFGLRPRRPAQRISQKYLDMAASIQSVTEDLLINIARKAKICTGVSNLCLAGGVALNCVANSKLLQSRVFDKIWIQPAAGDAGSAIGAACLAYYELNKKSHLSTASIKPLTSPYLGPKYSETEIELALNRSPYRSSLLISKFSNKEDLIRKAAQDLHASKVLGWFQGRMEFGPRALGARSILANPQIDTMQNELNLKIKFRELFRPFAPVVLLEKTNEWFDLPQESPFMQYVAHVKKQHILPVDESKVGLSKSHQKRSTLPAITHVDNSARVQTVSKDQNYILYKLLKAFDELSTCPILVNTSFNIRGEPIVCSPKDALQCFCGTGLDILYIENFRIEKNTFDTIIDKNYSTLFLKD